MSRKFPLLTLMATTAFGIGTAQCKECHGISFPEQTQSDGAALTLNGLGMRQATLFKVNVYVAALYVAKPTADPNVLLGAAAPYQLILHFVRSVDASDISKGWVEGFARNAQAQAPGLQERIAMLTRWMTDIKSGQRLQFSFKPGAGLQVNVNGAMKGTISGDDFGRAFLSIWLGVPPNPEVKSGMLGGACG
jgi:chalcone isomerase-like protein